MLQACGRPNGRGTEFAVYLLASNRKSFAATNDFDTLQAVSAGAFLPVPIPNIGLPA
jgi:hypothetical protein